MKTVKESIRYRLKDGYSIFQDAVLDNSDGRAKGRQGLLCGTLSLHFLRNLISGTYFTGLLLAMDADDIYIGYITMIMTMCTFFQMFAPLYLEKMKRRKTLLLVIHSIYHFLNIVVVGVIPLMPWPKETILNVFMITVFLLSVTNALGAPGFSDWHMQSLPYERRISYWTVQNLTSQILGVCIAYIAGLFLDFFVDNRIAFGGISPTLTALLLLRILAVILAACEIYFYTWIKEYPYEKNIREKNDHGMRLLLLPLKNKAYIMTVSIQVLWTFIGGVIGPYFSVYLLDEVKMSYSFLALGGFISTPIILIMTPIWGKMLQRKRWINLLAMVMAGYSLVYLLNPLITSSTQFLYPVVILVSNFFSPCISVALGHLSYMKMPEQNRTAYLSLFSVLVQGASLLGTFVGTQFIAHTEDKVLNLFGFTMVNKQYLNLIQFALALCLVFYVRKIAKTIQEEK